jgi:hypothetical protein
LHKNENEPRPELLNLSFGMYFQGTDGIWNDNTKRRRRKVLRWKFEGWFEADAKM